MPGSLSPWLVLEIAFFFVRNRYLPIAFEKGNEGIPSVVTRIVQVECE